MNTRANSFLQYQSYRLVIAGLAVFMILFSLSSCEESSVNSSLQDDIVTPTIRVGDITEGDTLEVEEDENNGRIDFEFLDDSGLKSYSIQINSGNTTEIEVTGDTTGTQVIQSVDISALETDQKYTVAITSEDDSGNSSELNFVLFVRPGVPEAMYENMYLVGGATPGGWDLASQTPMTADETNPNIFSWTGELSTGEFKFKAYAAEDFCGGDWVHPLSQGQDLSSTEYQVLLACDGNTDYKWEISEAGTYEIVLNLEAETVHISLQQSATPEPAYDNLYLVGDATPGGWDLSSQTPMTQDGSNPNIFSWSGALTAGNFKIKAYESTSGFCSGEWIHPLTNDPAFSETGYEILMGCAEDNPDNQWVIENSEAGDYNITVDLQNETINITAQ